MKKTILILAVATTFISCKKCYECKVTYTQSVTGSADVRGEAITEVCGTKKEIEEAEATGTYTVYSNAGNIHVTQKYKTTCK